MNYNLKIFYLFLLFLLISCQHEKCEWEKEMFRSEWNYTVHKLYKHEHFKATYVIETEDGRELLFRPIQSIYTSAEPGDKIIKDKLSEKAMLVKMNWKEKDTMEFKRIYSPSCDDEISKISK
jgi:hypothetical protein